MNKIALFFVSLLVICFVGCTPVTGTDSSGGGTSAAATKYTVTYNANGGTGSVPVDATKYASGEKATVLSSTTIGKSGFGFACWNTSANGSGTSYSPNFAFSVTGNITLYAVWVSSTTPLYDVIFETNGGSSIPKLTGLISGSLVAKPSDPSKSGYTFSGWYSDSALVTVWTFTTDTITANKTLYAKWTAASPGTTTPGTTTPGTTTPGTTTPGTTTPGTTTPGTGGLTVTFNTNGGSAINSQSVVSGSTVTMPANPVKEGYVLTGWYKDSALTILWDFTTGTVTSDMTLYAKWDVQTFTVYIYPQYGASYTTQTLPYGSLVTKPADPTYQDYRFDGWQAYNAYGTEISWNFATDRVTGYIMFKALWSIPCDITFFSSKGSTPPGQRLLPGSYIVKPVDPGYADYQFMGWYTDSACTKAWDFAVNKVGTGTYMTLYAKWVPTSIIVEPTLNPLYVGITTYFSSLTFGTSKTAKLTVNGELSSDVAYSWYVDGVLDTTQKTTSWTGGSTLSKGPHSLMAMVSDRNCFGSATMYFVVK